MLADLIAHNLEPMVLNVSEDYQHFNLNLFL